MFSDVEKIIWLKNHAQKSKNQITKNAINSGHSKHTWSNKKFWKSEKYKKRTSISCFSVNKNHIHLKMTLKKQPGEQKACEKAWEYYNFFLLICFVQIFLSRKSSTSAFGGNQVGGLPPVSSVHFTHESLCFVAIWLTIDSKPRTCG